MPSFPLLRGYCSVLQRDITALIRRPFDWLLPLLFFMLVNLLFGIAAGGDAAMLAAAAPAVVWSAVLLAALLANDGILRPDFESGFIDQVLVSPQPLPLFALAKATVHWLYTGLPLVLLAPAAAVMLGLPAGGVQILALTLPPATIALSLFAVFAAALAAGQKNHLLAALLALPLTIPVLIFAVAAVDSAAAGQPALAALAFLSALAVLALTLLPLAIAAAIRIMGGQ